MNKELVQRMLDILEIAEKKGDLAGNVTIALFDKDEEILGEVGGIHYFLDICIWHSNKGDHYLFDATDEHGDSMVLDIQDVDSIEWRI